MTKHFWLGICGGLAVAALLAGPASAQDKDQFKCQQKASKAGAKFIGAKSKCVLKCEKNARKGKNPFTDCDPPYAGTTAECVAKAEGKLDDGINKGCAKGCPDCYNGGDCAGHATATVADLEAKLDIFVPLIVCDPDSQAGNKDVDKCIDATGKTLSKFAASKTKCYDKCVKLENKGKIPAGSCVPTAVTDQKTLDCIAKAESKAVAGLNKQCYDKLADPACWIIVDADQWVGLVEASVDDTVPVTYCGSPSGAFLN